MVLDLVNIVSEFAKFRSRGEVRRQVNLYRLRLQHLPAQYLHDVLGAPLHRHLSTYDEVNTFCRPTDYERLLIARSRIFKPVEISLAISTAIITAVCDMTFGPSSHADASAASPLF